MTGERYETDVATRAGMLWALVAQQVGAKVTRDALFLSGLDVTTLPTMLIVPGPSSIELHLEALRRRTPQGNGPAQG